MIDEESNNPPEMTMTEAKKCIEFLLASKGEVEQFDCRTI